jgi:hypothetical protein
MARPDSYFLGALALSAVRPPELDMGEPSRAFFVCIGSDVMGFGAPLEV